MVTIKLKYKHKLDILRYLIVKVKRDDPFALASQLAYYLVLSFFPFMLFVTTLAGFSKLSSNIILEQLSVILPRSVLELTKSTIREVFDKQYTGLLGLSIVLMVWTSSSAFKAVIKSLNKAYGYEENRSFIKLSLISMMGIFALALTIICALAMLVFGNVIGDYIKHTYTFYKPLIILWNLFRHAFILIIMIAIFMIIYRLAPTKKLAWIEVVPGSVFSALGWILISLGFSFYIDNFNNYSRFYGSLGAVFVLMTWIFIISIIFILGVEINFVRKEIKESKHEY